MAKTQKAFSSAELLVVLIILTTFAFIAIPKLQFGTLRRQKADTVARKISTDLQLTRRLAITNAAINTDGYELNMTGGSPYSGYQLVNRNTSEVVDSYAIDSEISCTGGSSFEFGPLGNLLSAGTQVTVSAEGKIFTITVTPATGMVKCTSN